LVSIKKFCPIIYTSNYAGFECLEEKCAWWSKEYKKCCLTALADRLEDLEADLYELFGEKVRVK
jgi:hypothetical protein